MSSDIKQDHIIRQISAPSIKLDDIAVIDTQSGAPADGVKGTIDYPVKYQNAQGSTHPLIQINNSLFGDTDISSMQIDTSGFLPTISVTIIMRTKILYTSGFPKDGDVLSIFIRSKDDSYKPIRNDYEITSVRVQEENGNQSVGILNISGILYVRGLKNMQCFSKPGTSYEVLKSVAEDLELGFATNEIDTQDAQKWLCAYKTLQSFILDVSDSAWKDEKSFFTSFVDIFYNLNFVNVDPLFSIKPGKELGISVESYSNDHDIDSELIKNSLSILFTNHQLAKYSSQWINKYEQRNKANFINRSQGYVKYNHYYDALLKKKVMFFNDPITTTEEAAKNYVLKGKNSTDERFSRVTHNWMGTSYGGNGENQHSTYLRAKTWNHQNMVHLDKLYLEVELDQINMTIRKYQVVPLLIVVYNDMERRMLNAPNDTTNSETPVTDGTPNSDSNLVKEEELEFVIEKFYSGNYVVQDIFYQYQNGHFTQKLKLLRRVWPPPPQLQRNT